MESLKDRWVAALQSDDYVQSRGRLRREPGDGPPVCCLGVLCDVYIPDGGNDHYSGYREWSDFAPDISCPLVLQATAATPITGSST